MIVLDTHIWIWWVHGDARLTTLQVAWLEQYESQGLGVSAISCWEVAKSVEYKRLVLPCQLMRGWIMRSHIREFGFSI